MRRLDRISRRLNTAVKYTAGLLLGAMAILVFLQVLFRYVLEAPLDWSEEMSTFAFTWMALLGASVGLKNDEHPRLDILLVRFPQGLQLMAKAVTHLAIIFMLVIFFIFGLKLTLTMKMQTTAALGYSVSFVYAILPITAIVMLLHMVARTVVLFGGRKMEGE